MAKHGACGKSWSGNRVEHCGACHETFRSHTAGDMHRVGSFDNGTRRCMTPFEMRVLGMRQDSSERWMAPARETDWSWRNAA